MTKSPSLAYDKPVLFMKKSFTKRRCNRSTVINTSMLSMTSLLLCAVVVAVFSEGPRLATASNNSSVVQLLEENRAVAGSISIVEKLTLQRTLGSSSSLIAATTVDSSFFKTKSSSSSIATSSIPDYELQALKDLYDSTDGDNWVWTGNHWDFSDAAEANPCDGGNTWQGIYCSDYYHVTYIELTRCNLVGSLPSSLGLLSELTGLILFINKLTGIIPASLGQLTKLTQLYLFANELTGSLPESLGNMISMQVLLVCENFLTGTLPSSLGQLSQLIALDSDNNQFQGTIPNSLGDLTQLDELTLHFNQMDGIIPSSLCNYYHRILYLWGNNFVCYPECLVSAVTYLGIDDGTPLCDDIPSSTSSPSFKPTRRPTRKPTRKPSYKSTHKPSFKPSHKPSYKPTRKPSFRPTRKPTRKPTGNSTLKPTCNPTGEPTI